MVLRNDGEKELSPPIWCSSKGMQSTKDCVNTPEGATAWFGPNPPQKNIIQLDQTDNLKTFLKGEPQVLGVAQILIGLMKVCLFAIGLRFHSSDFPHWCYSPTMDSGYLIWGSLFFFVSGAVSIAAGRNMTLNLGGRAWNRRMWVTLIILFQIRGSLGVNILSAVVGGVGIILSTVELTVVHGLEKSCLILRALEIGLLVLSLLEISIAISLSVFGCKVTCFVTQVVVIQPNNDKVPSVMAPYEHIYEDLKF
ncbi:membrane-spanning 4-domains subfamily A member 4A-like isoform X2 [Lontra canadensis]|uniref:membrane-spanning 4-domains subfamily A member 4A-like isoform X1 n=1 Tax=Lontra canadensis TaxID=76717 RepID=UPI0013F2D86C|nr:membrane-spanning 4-domains subfamily A member 4A-like isoform X1 [Lontra canadensis]XP_032734935.1 membrane-spanning 4-domains subfamily A member 4A-like isoform X2 [Lontra canadensis]